MEKKENTKKRKKNNKPVIILLIIILFIGAVVIGYFAVNKKDKFVGNWTVDGTTNYEFDGKGNGKLKLPTDEYKFTYKIEGNKLQIDYESKDATDSDYEYSFKGDKLHLKGLNNYAGEYELTKQK